MKLLTCDIGNTSIGFGVFENGKITKRYRVPHDEFIYSNLSKLEFDSAAISSVVPATAEKVIQLLKTQFGIESIVINSGSEFNLKIEYNSLKTLGIDRICGAEGAFYKFCSEKKISELRENEVLLTIDCGTATTINVIEPPATFSGGVIAPGLITMTKSLSEKTAQLPDVDLSQYYKVIGSNTESCITSGIINSTLGLIDRVINELEKSCKKISKIYLTGGNAKYLESHLSQIFEMENNLVLIGIYSVATRQIGKSK